MKNKKLVSYDDVLFEKQKLLNHEQKYKELLSQIENDKNDEYAALNYVVELSDKAEFLKSNLSHYVGGDSETKKFLTELKSRCDALIVKLNDLSLTLWVKTF